MSNDKFSDFKQYVDRFCLEYNISHVDAINHSIVKDVAKYYGLTDDELEQIKGEYDDKG